MVRRYKAKHDSVARYIPKEFQELADSFFDHLGKLTETPDKLMELIATLGFCYMAQAPCKSLEFKLIHISTAALACRELMKENTSETQFLSANGWLIGQVANYIIWVTTKGAAAAAADKIGSLVESFKTTADFYSKPEAHLDLLREIETEREKYLRERREEG